MLSTSATLTFLAAWHALALGHIHIQHLKQGTDGVSIVVTGRPLLGFVNVSSTPAT